ncbi:Uncharacterized protein dnm_035450 [Desulfonema magnum]|uniref:Uncharacterized protein n=1 Tax=Desulfonema magnum TaxID=45655 RepID=A0A975BL49_9BACT|nr:Uncharacterized protein dnm_035450 [Desulfonema magnum]
MLSFFPECENFIFASAEFFRSAKILFSQVLSFSGVRKFYFRKC